MTDSEKNHAPKEDDKRPRLISIICGDPKVDESSDAYVKGNGALPEKLPIPDADGGHEKVAYPTTYTETLIHIFKGNLGSGLFAMGDAVKNAGILVGPPVILLLGLICTHCMHMLLTASTKVFQSSGKKVAPDFAETVELCFETGPPWAQKMAKSMKTIVNVFLCVTQLGFCCVYFVFISSNLKQLADQHGFYLDVHVHMVLILLPIIMSCLVRNLKYLAPLSAIANVLLGTGVVITFYYVTQDLPSISERTYVAPVSTMPLFFGTALFAFEGIGLVLPLKNEMRQPELFQKPLGVLNVGMVIVTLLYCSLGTMAYMKYGEGIFGSVTLNLPENDILGQSVKAMISTAILLSYALQFYIAVDIMWPNVLKHFKNVKHPVFGELAFRTALVLVTFILAEAIPYLNLFISLVGAVSSTALALLIPPVLQLITTEKTPLMVAKNSLILLVGVVGCVTGTYESLHRIIDVLQHPNETA